ncbi:sigma-70 family RNA polymerase sigma factor [Candidatus Peregrinibacteria bacterium]|nr:sigma-70 family RNA polymerase sigma factor [Candidatus Peregrinibacteria bacterium]
MEEAKAIALCQKGDLTAFSTLYDEYIKPIYNFVFYKTHHKETAEDLVSIVFTKSLEKIQTFNSDKASFKTWLYQIARNTITDHFRSNKETADIDDVWGLSTKDDIVTDLDVKMKMEEVKKYLKKLKSSQREVVMLRVWGGHSFQEIAEITGKTEASCKMMFKRTIENLRGDLAVLALLIYFI